MASTKVFLTFPQRLIKDPVLFDLAKRFDIQTNIRGASVTDEIALVALQIEGAQDQVTAALEHLAAQGVQIEKLDG